MFSKRTLERMFVDVNRVEYLKTNEVIAFFTILSILGLVLETVPAFSKYQLLFSVIEWVAVVVFSFEYLARLYLARVRWQYVFSFFGLVDLISILPTLLGIGNLTFLKSARALRIIRLLRIVRLVKVAKLPKRDLDESLGVVGLNIAIYMVVLICALLLSGTIMYIVEGDAERFASIPAGMWWSLKVFMGSIPVEAPLSAAGGVAYVAARFVGLLLLGVLIGVVGNIFRVLLLSQK